jgi:transcriptional regulator with XRE-family HTH domain
MSQLAELRRSAGFTQRKLAQKLGLALAYGQKKVSQWEAGLSKPNERELARLAKILKTPPGELAIYFEDPGTQSTMELANRLAKSNRPSLFAICYSGRPRIMVDSFIRARFVEAVRRELSVAMFVPYPMGLPASNSSSQMLLAGYYNRVWGSVLEVRERLQAEVSAERKIAVYGPKTDIVTQPFLIPPFSSRYALLLEKKPQGDPDKSLYLSVETAEKKNLQLIGTAKNDATNEEIQNWEGFFNPIITAWMADNSLPHQDCGNWQYVCEAPPKATSKTLR